MVGAILTVALAGLAAVFAFLLGASGNYPRVGRSPGLQRLSGIFLVMALAALTVIVAGAYTTR